VREPFDVTKVAGWPVTVVESTGSTNADLLSGTAPDGTVLVAETQTAGRGRLGRTWVSPPRAALTFSVLLRPPVVNGWLPLAAGVAVATAVRDLTGLRAVLKWPNDVLHHQRKLAGILAERSASGAVVLGIGLNVSTTKAELPRPGPGALEPTSLLAEGAPDVAREDLLVAILRSLREPDREEYRALCDTLGRDVRVELPGDRVLEGTAEDIDHDGRLLLRLPSGEIQPVTAGDVVHIRLTCQS
jgi:BirA family biotin operon repressor/biotin-[acetyl-CoA-carboxylase] ligase